MDEISKQNFLVINERLKSQGKEMSLLKEQIRNYQNQVGNFMAKISLLEQRVNMIMQKVYGSGPTVSEDGNKH